MHSWRSAAVAIAAVTAVVAVVGLHAQPDPHLQTVQRAVSIGEIGKTLSAFNVDRTSGKDGERRSANYLAQKLIQYGVKHTTFDARIYMSWPVRAQLVVTGPTLLTFKGVTPAFGASTPDAGLARDVYVLPPNGDFGPDTRGKFVVAPGGVSPDRALAAQRAGVAGLIQVSDDEIVHEMIATTIWGSPTTESASRLPNIPIIGIKHSEGDRLKAALASAKSVTMTTKVDQGWAVAPLVVADVPGKSPDFVLIATHIDAWYEGMTDTAGSDASILEMAHVLQQNQSALERGVRFAWWPGHSFGRYAGSTWYVDRNWLDLDAHCVAYTNLDGPGRRGSQMDKVSAGGWPGIAEYSREFAQTLTGKVPEGRGNHRGGLFRPTRDSDSSFQGLGIPEFSIGVPGPPPGHPDLEANGQISYWHTANDTLEKLDMKALELDTKYRVAQLYALGAAVNLPLKVAPIAASLRTAVDELAQAAGPAFDLTSTKTAVHALAEAGARLDATAPTDHAAAAATNALLVRVTHRLNAVLYTKAGRYDQDPAGNVSVLPLLARARELATLPKDSDAHGFLETELLRGRNAVDATLNDATGEIVAALGSGARSAASRQP